MSAHVNLITCLPECITQNPFRIDSLNCAFLTVLQLRSIYIHSFSRIEMAGGRITPMDTETLNHKDMTVPSDCIISLIVFKKTIKIKGLCN